MRYQKNRHSGFALFDLMLAVAVMGLLSALALPYMLQGQRTSQAKEVADDFAVFQSVASDHFLNNKSAYVAAMTDGTGAAALCKINVNPLDGTGGTQANSLTLHTCAVDTSQLRFLSALPAGVALNNRYRERWVAIFRLTYDTQPTPAPTGGVEMLIVSADVTGAGAAVAPDATEYGGVQEAANFVGGNGGAVPDADRSTCIAQRSTSQYQVCGNAWRVNLADYIDAASLTTFGNRLAN